MKEIILEMYINEGLSVAEIASSYHLDPEYVYDVVYRRRGES